MHLDIEVQEGYQGELFRAVYSSSYSDSNPLKRVLIPDVGRNIKDGKGKNAYMKLAPGQSFAVEADVETLTKLYGNSGWDLSHTLIIRADKTALTRN